MNRTEERTGRSKKEDSGKSLSGSAGKRNKHRQRPEISEERNSRIIDGMTFGFSAALLLGCIAGALYTGTFRTLPRDFFRILTSPGPLVTDYFMIGSMPATFLNAGLCGAVMSAFMILLPGPSHVNTLAGYFLVIAHCLVVNDEGST